VDGWKARRIPCASLLLSAAAAIVFLRPSLAAELQYDRGAIAAGEWWRLVTGHWTHYGADHFFWDVLAFSVLGVACEQRSRCRFLVCVAASALAVSLAVWLWLPGMTGYRGLSGIDSALFALLFVEFWGETVRSGERNERNAVVLLGACLAIFLFKIVFELTTGTNLFVKTLESGPVGVPLAHIAGATVGFMVGLGAVNRRILGVFIHKTSLRVSL
jgi:rhomboid family GlyGly-CTERM serine protease